jgi:hypothetical protein
MGVFLRERTIAEGWFKSRVCELLRGRNFEGSRGFFFGIFLGLKSLTADFLPQHSRNQGVTVKGLCTLNNFGFMEDCGTLTAR